MLQIVSRYLRGWCAAGVFVLVGVTLLTAESTVGNQRPRVLEVALDGVVQPVTAEMVASGLRQAADEGDELVILRLDTPGGLMEAMRGCVAKIIASPVPVVTYVGPAGARAASAGFFILEAGDVAAMSPGTNTGAAHPVIFGATMDPVMKQKLENDAAASLRSVTSQRGRNVELAESAVRQSRSFSAREALDGHLVELLARDEDDLLSQLNGREITRFHGAKMRLNTAGARVAKYLPTLRQRILVEVSDPNVALILFALGVLGIYIEFVVPGVIVPGVGGSILVVVGFAALSVLPLNWLGVLLLVLAVAMFALELKFTSHGALSAGGAIALVLGATMLIDSPIPEMRIRLVTALAVAAPLAIITGALLTLAMRARRNKVITGAEGMLGAMGVALEELAPMGRVLVHGENWAAESRTKVLRGARVRVRAIKDLRLFVEPEQLLEQEERKF